MTLLPGLKLPLHDSHSLVVLEFHGSSLLGVAAVAIATQTSTDASRTKLGEDNLSIRSAQAVEQRVFIIFAEKWLLGVIQSVPNILTVVPYILLDGDLGG